MATRYLLNFLNNIPAPFSPIYITYTYIYGYAVCYVSGNYEAILVVNVVETYTSIISFSLNCIACFLSKHVLQLPKLADHSETNYPACVVLVTLIT